MDDREGQAELHRKLKETLDNPAAVQSMIDDGKPTDLASQFGGPPPGINPPQADAAPAQPSTGVADDQSSWSKSVPPTPANSGVAQPAAQAPVAPAKPYQAKDSELEMLLGQSAKRRQNALYGMAGNTIADAFMSKGKQGGGDEFWKNFATQGDRAITDLKARREGADEMAKADPNSPLSVASRDFLSKAVPGMADAFKDKSAKDLEQIPFMKNILDQMAASGRLDKAIQGKVAAVGAKTEADKADIKSMYEAATKLYGPQMEKRGLTLDSLMSNPSKEAAKQTLQSFQDDLNNEARIKAAGIGASRQVENKIGEEDRKAQEGVPSGWYALGNPTNEQKNKFTTGLTSSEKLKEGISEMRALLAKHPGYDPGKLVGEDARNMRRIATQLAVEGKNIAELGALSGGDYALMNSLVSDPTKLQNFIWNDAERGMDDLQSWAERQVNGAKKSYGIHPINSPEAQDVIKQRNELHGTSAPIVPRVHSEESNPKSAASASPPKPGMVLLMDPSNKPFWVDASEVEEATKPGNGWKRAPQ